MSEATLWEQVKEAILALGGKATYAEIVDYVVGNNPGTARRNVLTGIFACTVNHHARIHYMAREEGVADQAYDFLFQSGSRPGTVEWYDPERHGTWGNKRGEDGRLKVVQLEPAKNVPQAMSKRSGKGESVPARRVKKKPVRN